MNLSFKTLHWALEAAYCGCFAAGTHSKRAAGCSYWAPVRTGGCGRCRCTRPERWAGPPLSWSPARLRRRRPETRCCRRTRWRPRWGAERDTRTPSSWRRCSDPGWRSASHSTGQWSDWRSLQCFLDHLRGRQLGLSSHLSELCRDCKL